MIVIEVMPSPGRHDNPTIQQEVRSLGRPRTSRLAFRICGHYLASVSLAYPSKPDEEREKEAHRH
jgi:hypothetical protein